MTYVVAPSRYLSYLMLVQEIDTLRTEWTSVMDIARGIQSLIDFIYANLPEPDEKMLPLELAAHCATLERYYKRLVCCR